MYMCTHINGHRRAWRRSASGRQGPYRSAQHVLYYLVQDSGAQDSYPTFIISCYSTYISGFLSVQDVPGPYRSAQHISYCLWCVSYVCTVQYSILMHYVTLYYIIWYHRIVCFMTPCIYYRVTRYFFVVVLCVCFAWGPPAFLFRRSARVYAGYQSAGSWVSSAQHIISHCMISGYIILCYIICYVTTHMYTYIYIYTHITLCNSLY